MVGWAVRCGGCSTSVLWHLLSSEKEDGRCRLPSRPNLSLCRLAPSTYPVWLDRGHEGDHHRSPQFTDCVRMVQRQRCYQPDSSTNFSVLPSSCSRRRRKLICYLLVKPL